MKRITYIFTGSRINRLGDSNYADEFFYGLRHLKNKHITNIIEFNSKENTLLGLSIICPGYLAYRYIYFLLMISKIVKF